MESPNSLTGTDRAQVFNYFCDLIEISDSFDQFTKIALILDKLYQPGDIEHKPLFDMLEMVIRHRRDLHPLAQVAAPACSALHCPCPAGNPCDREAM